MGGQALGLEAAAVATVSTQEEVAQQTPMGEIHYRRLCAHQTKPLINTQKEISQEALTNIMGWLTMDGHLIINVVFCWTSAFFSLLHGFVSNSGS